MSDLRFLVLLLLIESAGGGPDDQDKNEVPNATPASIDQPVHDHHAIPGATSSQGMAPSPAFQEFQRVLKWTLHYSTT